MSEHTPLRVRKDMFGWPHIYDSDGERISNSRPSFSLEDWGKICCRIVACVNACKNIPIETLEDGGVEFALAKADERAEEAERLLEAAAYYAGSWTVEQMDKWQAEVRAFLDRRPK